MGVKSLKLLTELIQSYVRNNSTSYNTSETTSVNQLNSKCQSNVYPSEYSTFSYKPQYFKPADRRKNYMSTKSNTSDKSAKWSVSRTKKIKPYVKSMSSGQSLTFIKQFSLADKSKADRNDTVKQYLTCRTLKNQ